MGIPVLILGESGSGKSASLRNFKPGEILIFNVANKPLPFREKLDCLDKSGYRAIFEEFKARYPDLSRQSSFSRKGSGLFATLKTMISPCLKFLSDADFPEPDSPKINTGIPNAIPPFLVF